MTLYEIQKKVSETPDQGTEVLRPVFEKQWWLESGKYKDAQIQLSVNYRCLDPYSNKQRVVHEGILCSLWRGTRNDAHLISNKENLASYLEQLYQEVGRQCEHDEGRELGGQECREKGITHFGNCYHVYECSKCKKIYHVDTSD